MVTNNFLSYIYLFEYTVQCPFFCCSTESLRKYPPVPNLVRLVVKDYKVPELDLELKKGMLVHIPVYAIQHDPEFYEDVSAFSAKNYFSC